MNTRPDFKSIKILIWGKNAKTPEEIDQKFDPEATMKDFKSIVLNFTKMAPF
jgi:hypothetical protein